MPPENALLETLLAEVRRDLWPVRPLRPGRGLIVALGLAAAVLLALLWWIFGLRGDSGQLGYGTLWGLSAAQSLAAAAVLGLAARSTVPGRLPNVAVLAAVALVAAAIQIAALGITFYDSPLRIPAGQELGKWFFCICLEIALGLPLLALVLAVLRGGVLSTPGRIGILAGLGAGIAGDSLWRLICPYSQLSHGLAAHSGGVAAVIGTAWLVALAWERSRHRIWRLGRA